VSARGFWVVGPRRGEIRDEPAHSLRDGDVLVRTIHSGVSHGTELLVFEGRVPESERGRMRAPFQSGDFPFPVKYGYSSVGRIVDGPEHLIGRVVFCLYPHQTEYVAPHSAVLPLPGGIPESRAVLAANLETALNGIWDAGVAPGDRVTVVGGGVVGLLTAYLAAACPGTRVEVIDVDPSKAEITERLGATFASPSSATGDADVVIHASGSPAGLRTALELAGQEATVVELSWFGASKVELSLGEAFHARRLRIQSSQVGAVPPARRARWTNRRRLALALELLEDERLDALVTSSCRFEDLPAAFDALARETARKTLCLRVDYG